MGLLFLTPFLSFSGLIAAVVALPQWLLALVCLLCIVVGVGLTYIYMYKQQQRLLASQKVRLDKYYFDLGQERKHQFFINVSNELRAPLALVINPLQAILEEPMKDDLRARLQMILGNAQLLLHQVNMLLDSRHVEGIGNKAQGAWSTVLPENPLPQVVYEPLASQKTATNETATPQGVSQPSPAQFTAPVASNPEPTPASVNAPDTSAPQPTDSPAKQENVASSGVDDSNAAEAADLAAEALLEKQMTANHQFTMLMVDDSADMCRFVRDYFRGEYNVLTASNGEQALQTLEENDSIDLVVSDVAMPKMDGLELCKRVKTDLRWSHIPVILLTGRTGEQMEVEGLKQGADDYITKPFNVDKLRLRVKKLIETKEHRQQQFKERIDISPSEITITSVDEEFIQTAIKICEEHITDTSFSVEVLGQGLAMSRTYLYRKLMSITGKGPAEFIRIIRLKRAKQYLEQTHMPIADIAAAVGYGTSKRFSENFKIEFGMSPSEYMRKHREGQKIKI